MTRTSHFRQPGHTFLRVRQPRGKARQPASGWAGYHRRSQPGPLRTACAAASLDGDYDAVVVGAGVVPELLAGACQPGDCTCAVQASSSCRRSHIQAPAGSDSKRTPCPRALLDTANAPLQHDTTLPHQRHMCAAHYTAAHATPQAGALHNVIGTDGGVWLQASWASQ